jgi:hypothetical protein
MTDYRHRHFTGSNSSGALRHSLVSPRKQTLARRLGYAIDSEDESSDDEESCLCIMEQELSSYEGLNVEKKTDVLRFWEVGSLLPSILDDATR